MSAGSGNTTPRGMPRSGAIAVDAVLVVLFCFIGRLSHAEQLLGDAAGTLQTIWPFLVAACVGHAVAAFLRTPVDRLLPGVIVWAVTVVGGLLLRAASGQGTAPSFMVVTVLVLAAFLLGWRLLRVLLRRVRRRGAA